MYIPQLLYCICVYRAFCMCWTCDVLFGVSWKSSCYRKPSLLQLLFQFHSRTCYLMHRVSRSLYFSKYNSGMKLAFSLNLNKIWYIIGKKKTMKYIINKNFNVHFYLRLKEKVTLKRLIQDFSKQPRHFSQRRNLSRILRYFSRKKLKEEFEIFFYRWFD